MKKTLLCLAVALAGLMATPSFAADTPPAPPPPSSTVAADSSSPSSPSPSPSSPAPAKTAAASRTTVRARVLIDCEHGKANDVVTLDSDVAKSAAAGGVVDTDKAAVAYALTLPQNQPKPNSA